jgi:hypothetical protein
MNIQTNRSITVLPALIITALSAAFFLKGSNELPDLADNSRATGQTVVMLDREIYSRQQAQTEEPMDTVLILAPRGSAPKTHS